SLFSYQFQFNDIYQSFCRQQGKTPRMVKSWREIPAVPLQAFKSSTLSCTEPQKAEAVFMTSGTTSPAQRGKHYHASLRLYNASMLAAFKHYMLESGSKQSMVLLFPDKQQLPNSSLAHYLHLAKENFGSPHSAYAMNKYGIDPEKAISLLES